MDEIEGHVLIEIFAPFVTVSDLLRISRSCRKWRGLLDDVDDKKRVFIRCQTPYHERRLYYPCTNRPMIHESWANGCQDGLWRYLSIDGRTLVREYYHNGKIGSYSSFCKSVRDQVEFDSLKNLLYYIEEK